MLNYSQIPLKYPVAVLSVKQIPECAIHHFFPQRSNILEYKDSDFRVLSVSNMAELLHGCVNSLVRLSRWLGLDSIFRSAWTSELAHLVQGDLAG